MSACIKKHLEGELVMQFVVQVILHTPYTLAFLFGFALRDPANQVVIVSPLCTHQGFKSDCWLCLTQSFKCCSLLDILQKKTTICLHLSPSGEFHEKEEYF